MSGWLIADKNIIEVVGIIGGLLLSGLGLILTALALYLNGRALRAQTNLEVTKQHREFLFGNDNRPEAKSLFDRARDLSAHPLTKEEVRFANFLFLHIRGAYHLGKAGIYVQPKKFREDVRDIFSHPGARAAWTAIKGFHDDDFVAFIEGNLS